MHNICQPSLSRRLVRLLRQRAAPGVPAHIRAKTCLHIADSVGIAIAATRAGAMHGQLLQGTGGGMPRGPGTTFGAAGGGDRSPVLAAFVNAALIHTLDFDDIHDAARLHPTAVTLPAALAAAGLVQASGARIADAVALGNELMCRLGIMYSPMGNGPGADWFLTQLFGYFGACASAASVLELDEDEWVSAFGLAYMQAAGGKEAGFGVGATGRAIYPAFAAMGGLHAALLARAGIVGPAGALDGPANLFRLYLQGDPSQAQIEGLLDPQGWAFEAVQIKPWPSCRLSHPYVSAALALREMPNVQGAQGLTGRITVAVNASAARLCEPLAGRRRPVTLQDAKYSVPYMTAFALLTGRVDLSTLDDRVLHDARLHAIVDRLDIERTLPDKPGHPPAELHALTTCGEVLVVRASHFDLDAGGVREKFTACLAHAGRSEAEAADLWSRLAQLDLQQDTGFVFG